jgi:hypothetical protein
VDAILPFLLSRNSSSNRSSQQANLWGECGSENARSFHTLLNTIRKEATNNKQMQQQQALLTAGSCSWKKG